LDKGAKLDLRDYDNETALMMASEKGHKDVCKILLDKGAKLDLQTNSGVTALMMASMNEMTEIVKLLLEKGANTGLKSKGGKTAYDWTQNDTIKTLLTTYKKKK
jgi:ankyrin repeat protein